MAKSYRTCYYRDQKEFFDRDRPMGWESSNKANKTMCHRIERAWAKRRTYKEVQQYYEQ